MNQQIIPCDAIDTLSRKKIIIQRNHAHPDSSNPDRQENSVAIPLCIHIVGTSNGAACRAVVGHCGLSVAELALPDGERSMLLPLEVLPVGTCHRRQVKRRLWISTWPILAKHQPRTAKRHCTPHSVALNLGPAHTGACNYVYCALAAYIRSAFWYR